MGDKGAIVISNAIKSNPSLKFIDLRDNQCEETGKKVLSYNIQGKNYFI